MSHVKSMVMVVDDEESVREVIRRALEKQGYNTITAANGREALEKASQHDIEVVLLDIMMPGLSGTEVLTRLIAGYPDTMVIMVTAVAQAEVAVDAMKIGAYDYITKPFNLDDLAMRVSRAIERRRLVLQKREYEQSLDRLVKEQAQRLREQFVQLLDSLAREHRHIYQLEALRSKKRGKGEPLAVLPPELRTPAGSVEEFAKALRKLLRSGWEEKK